jgi:predicted phage terminase large subunit-like protein
MTDAVTARLQDQLKATNRLIAIQEARKHLLPFLRLVMPDHTDPDDATKSRYVVTPQARLLCEVMEKVRARKLKRVAISIGPQMGKTQILSRAGPAWLQGLDPYRHSILGTYNQDQANGLGFDVRSIMQSNVYRQVFPGVELLPGGEAKDLLITKEGGKMAFIGIGGSGSGKPSDDFIIDDPYRNNEDANSSLYREQVWRWFNGVVLARARDRTTITVIHTRWHQDDLIGRLCDPDHPERRGLYAGIEKRWTYINIPAVVTDPELAAALGLTLKVPTEPEVIEQFGSKPMSALWPDDIAPGEGIGQSLPLMAESRMGDKRNFESMYMGRPSPDEGTYFQKDYIAEYDRGDLPKTLRIYGASDHAVSKKQGRDLTCLGCVGVDEHDEIWVLPGLVWARMETDKTVEELIAQFKAHRPMMWWLESELISKSFGPFLKKRMQTEKTYTLLDPIPVASDIETRARSIQGMMALRMVHFPRFTPWWQTAKQQLLNFPAATHDDFVAWLALVGLGLQKQIKPRSAQPKKTEPPSGSIAWILKRSDEKHRKEARNKAVAGW